MKGTLRLVLVLTSVCLVASFSLALVNQVTAPRIAQQKKEAKLSAIRKVLPQFDNDPIEDKKELVETFYLGKKKGKIVGVAVEAKGEGYGADISVIVGIDLKGEVTGVEILEHLETPGLGARVELSEFMDQFLGKSLANSKLVDGSLAVGKDGGDIDALTGATISSCGVTQAVDRALKIFQAHKKEILR